MVYSYNLSLTSGEMSVVNLLAELPDVRACRRLEMSGYDTNEIDCLISSACSLVIDTISFSIICCLIFYFVLLCTISF